jgi:hypothetical protein
METIADTPQAGKDPNSIIVPNAQLTGPTKIVFGLAGYNLETPANIKAMFNLFLLFATIAVIVVNGFPEIPVVVKNYVLEAGAVITLIAKQIEQAFGVQTSNN